MRDELERALDFAEHATGLPRGDCRKWIGLCGLSDDDPNAAEMVKVTAYKTQQMILWLYLVEPWPDRRNEQKLGDCERVEKIGEKAGELLELIDGLVDPAVCQLRQSVALATDNPAHWIRLRCLPHHIYNAGERLEDYPEDKDEAYPLRTMLSLLRDACNREWKAAGKGRRRRVKEMLAHHLSDVFNEFYPDDDATETQRYEFIAPMIVALNERDKPQWDQIPATRTITRYLDSPPPSPFRPDNDNWLPQLRENRRTKAQRAFQHYVGTT